jgi:formate hydrogenlyase subunit 6/NADH:ubiquinone oxidoreductase subunit I
LDAAAYVGLAALGIADVRVHTAACAACPQGTLHAQIAAVADIAAALTTMPVTLVHAPPAAGAADSAAGSAANTGAGPTVVSTRAPRVSRRNLLRRLLPGKPAAPPSPLLSAPMDPTVQPPARRALLHAWAYLPPARRTAVPCFPVYAVAPTCTGCRVCATVCPTGALTAAPATPEDAAFILHFSPLACTQCDLCTQLCPHAALHLAGYVDYAGAVPRILHAAPQSRCRRCRAAFVGEGDLCPACAFRRRHPSASLARPE